MQCLFCGTTEALIETDSSWPVKFLLCTTCALEVMGHYKRTLELRLEAGAARYGIPLDDIKAVMQRAIHATTGYEGG